jgi:hypothetical protein
MYADPALVLHASGCGGTTPVSLGGEGAGAATSALGRAWEKFENELDFFIACPGWNDADGCTEGDRATSDRFG